MTVPCGARSGSLSQEPLAITPNAAAAASARRARRPACATMDTLKILRSMYLRGQASRAATCEKPGNSAGYAMAALLVAIAVMTVMLSVAMPVWRHEMQREREAELVFRGEQYVRAIDLFQRKYAGALPPTVDLLVTERFLRKKYKDPMTEDGEFRIVAAGAQQQPGTTQPGQQGTRRHQAGSAASAESDGAATHAFARADGPAGPAAGRRWSGHHRRRQQEQGKVHSALQGPEQVRRVAVHLCQSRRSSRDAGPAGAAGPPGTAEPARDEARFSATGDARPTGPAGARRSAPTRTRRRPPDRQAGLRPDPRPPG